MFYENVIKLCELKGISLTSLLHDELHMSTGNITRWKNGTVPNGETISKLAAYFGVTTDYLLGNKQKNKPTSNNADELRLNEKEKELLLAFRNLNGPGREMILRAAGVDIDRIDPKEIE